MTLVIGIFYFLGMSSEFCMSECHKYVSLYQPCIINFSLNQLHIFPVLPTPSSSCPAPSHPIFLSVSTVILPYPLFFLRSVFKLIFVIRGFTVRLLGRHTMRRDGLLRLQIWQIILLGLFSLYFFFF